MTKIPTEEELLEAERALPAKTSATTATRKRDEEKAKRIRAYLMLNQEEWGKVILADLKDFCGQDRSSMNEVIPNNLQTTFNEGKRRVWLRVDGFIKEGQHGLDK